MLLLQVHQFQMMYDGGTVDYDNTTMALAACSSAVWIMKAVQNGILRSLFLSAPSDTRSGVNGGTGRWRRAGLAVGCVCVRVAVDAAAGWTSQSRMNPNPGCLQ